MTKENIYVEKNNVIYRTDYSFENKEIEKVILAIYNKSLTKRGEYRALLGINMNILILLYIVLSVHTLSKVLTNKSLIPLDMEFSP